MRKMKGDKLEYVYDFGDDWVFFVEVKEHLIDIDYVNDLLLGI